jgi:hypothetical protein
MISKTAFSIGAIKQEHHISAFWISGFNLRYYFFRKWRPANLKVLHCPEVMMNTWTPA